MVAPGNKTCARRRAQRGGVHVVVTEAVLRKGIQIWSLAGTAEAADLPEAYVIEHDEQNIGRAFLRAQRLRPRWTRYIERPPDNAAKRGSRFVFFKCHFSFLQFACSL